MENRILVVSNNTAVLGIIDSSDKVEYTVYEAKKEGSVEVADGNKLDSIGAILALEADSIEYQDYELKEIK